MQLLAPIIPNFLTQSRDLLTRPGRLKLWLPDHTGDIFRQLLYGTWNRPAPFDSVNASTRTSTARGEIQIAIRTDG